MSPSATHGGIVLFLGEAGDSALCTQVDFNDLVNYYARKSVDGYRFLHNNSSGFTAVHQIFSYHYDEGSLDGENIVIS